MKLSDNFNLEEFTVTRIGTVNNPPPEAVANIKRLVKYVLQPVRNMLDFPLMITSGYRSPELNKAVGGATTSQHTKGEAADIQCRDNKLLLDTIRQHFEFDQLIYEFGDDKQPAWVHVSLKDQGNRNETLRAVKENGKTKYIRI